MVPVRPALVGGFVLGGLALGVAAIVLFGSFHLFSHPFRAVVFFQGSVSGLAVGAPVTFRGVKMGSVQHISLRLDVKDMKARIPVYLDLQAGAVSMVNGTLPVTKASFERLLEAGLKAQLNTSSFVTGQLQIDLDLRPDTTSAPMGGDPDILEIPSIPSQMETLKDQVAALRLHQLVDTSEQTLTSIRRVSDQLGERLGPFTEGVQKTLETARETLLVATETVRQLRSDVTRTLGDVDQLALEGRQQLTARGSELSHVLVAAGHTAHDAETVMASLNEMTSARSQTRGDLEATIRDLAATASSLRIFSREVERNPTTILTGRGKQ